MPKFTKNHHYAIDAAEELDLCRERLNLTMAITTEAPEVLYDLDAALVCTERIIHSYLVKLIELERQDVLESSIADILDNDNDVHSDFDSIPKSLRDSVDALRSVMMQKASSATDQNQREFIHHGSHNRLGLPRPHRRSPAFSSVKESDSASQPAGDCTNPVPAPVGRSVADSLLFRLVVALQLCQVRIDDAHFVIAGRRRGLPLLAKSKWTLVACVCFTAGAIGTWVSGKRVNSKELSKTMPRVFVGVALYAFARRQFRQIWMADKVAKSIEELEEWRKQWTLVHEGDSKGSISIEAKSQRLIEYALKQSPKTSFWHSEGELRFLMVKRCMDLLYASVGTAVEVTNDHKDWQIPLAAMAATYYSFVGPNRKAHEAVSSAAAQSLIQNTWGMVSLPAIKLLSLKASRLLKGAALAERININGVPCFILSKDPCPDIIASLKRYERQERRRSSVSRLSTIDEREGEQPARHRRTSISFTKRNVLLHLTGGGFFSHIIATDLPYLLNWSAKTGAIIICPEYALLPEAPFPTALNQVIEVYSSLLSGLTTSLLGFEVDRVIVTGESAGGNLAAALCVNLCLERNNDVESVVAEREAECRAADFETETSDQLSALRLPDALMLSCPALNMSLDISHSRVVGIEDPVLPAGLITAISDGYLPCGVNKKDPLASPLFAPDRALRHFPPTLLFASSDDPLLDDSIDFNKRLRCLGVASELKATHHVPHAFWGLGTAGFPEAVQVQIECEEFLVKHFDVRD
jgi:acetyl esterase/lipase